MHLPQRKGRCFFNEKHIIRNRDGSVTEYKGHRLSVTDSVGEVIKVEAKKYPMYDSVLEVTMKVPLTDAEIREAR